ncbi:MAG TPA: hypothetical protein VIN06_10205 [Devosia sp.]
MPTKPSTKPYVKLAYGLIIAGMAIFMLERFGLSNMSGPNHTPLHLDGTLLSIMVIAPVVLVVAGCLTFMVGRMLRRP